MLEVKEEELKKILPSDGPSIDEVKKYLEKYNDEYIVIKCGGSVLVDQNLFNIFISVVILPKIFDSNCIFSSFCAESSFI